MKRLILIALMAIFAVPPVHAACDWWDDGYHCNKRVTAAKRYKKKYRAPERSREREIRSYRHIEIDNDEPELECKPPVRGVGSQWIGPEGALEAATKDFMERVRYDYGESYLDMKNARGPYGEAQPVSRCGRTSIGETLGQVFYRCEIVARPCKALMAETVGKTK